MHSALMDIRVSVESLHKTLNLESVGDIPGFLNVLDSKLLPRTMSDYPLMVAITGGGSSGKSTLFNSLVGSDISLTKARAGLTRRTLAAVNPEVLKQQNFMENLFSTFSELPAPLKSADELASKGPPRYIGCETLPANIVLLDTPDFDTGDSSGLFNRDSAKPILEASDVIIYVFTGTTYNNLANTQFLGSILHDLGSRKIILVYRCYSTLSGEEVEEHAQTVLANIYGSEGSKWCLGIYRMNEENLVAEGRKSATLHPLNTDSPIEQTLGALSPHEVRTAFFNESIAKVYSMASAVRDAAESTRLQLDIYSSAVEIATSWAAADAVRSFPQVALLNRFIDIWNESKHFIIKAPVKIMYWIKNLLHRDQTGEDQLESLKSVFRKDLVESANKLRNQLFAEGFAVKISDNDPNCKQAMENTISLSETDSLQSDKFAIEKTLGGINLRVVQPTQIVSELSGKQNDSWELCLNKISEELQTVMEVSSEFEEKLREIARDFRKTLTFRERLRESVTSILPSLTAFTAITWVIGTGGTAAAGGGFIAYITSMFGMSDLLALIAIPAIPGLDKLHRATLAKLVEPIMSAWLEEKTVAVRVILDKHLSSPFLSSANEFAEQVVSPLKKLEMATETLCKIINEKGGEI